MKATHLCSLKEPVIVQKFGGSSLATVELALQVARKVVETKRRGHALVVVVSAMGKSTDQLMELARRTTANPSRRELDVLLGTGEHVSMSILSMAIGSLGEEAVSLSGGQCGILTNDVHSNARILEIRPQRVCEELLRGKIVVAAGFQGVDRDHQPTTLGRGGSDTTAVALAAALGAERCEIYTDVEGVFTADPRVVPSAHILEELSSREMQALAWHGAQVLKAEAVDFASSNNVPVSVHSTFSTSGGTRILPALPDSSKAGCYRPNHPPVAGVSGRKDLLRLTLHASAAEPDFTREIIDRIARYDLIFSTSTPRSMDLFISDQEMPGPEAFQKSLKERYADLVCVTSDLGAVSLVGFGIGSRPKSLFAAVEALRDAGITAMASFTGQDSLSFVIPRALVNEAQNELHRRFVKEVSWHQLGTQHAHDLEVEPIGKSGDANDRSLGV